jgi:hypothetical protein
MDVMEEASSSGIVVKTDKPIIQGEVYMAVDSMIRCDFTSRERCTPFRPSSVVSHVEASRPAYVSHCLARCFPARVLVPLSVTRRRRLRGLRRVPLVPRVRRGVGAAPIPGVVSSCTVS